MYRQAAINAGWQRKVFGSTVKWWNPTNDDGARYCDKESSLRHLCEDYQLAVIPSAPCHNDGSAYCYACGRGDFPSDNS